MARIKYILNERRIAAREAQDLVLEATQGSKAEAGNSAYESRKQASMNFMEEEGTKSASTQSTL
jgi:hypothetical protein